MDNKAIFDLATSLAHLAAVEAANLVAERVDRRIAALAETLDTHDWSDYRIAAEIEEERRDALLQEMYGVEG